MRSLSFTRSSAASRNSVTPSANAAATASTGISSITHGISAPSTVVPCSGARVTRSSPTGSPSRSPVVDDLDRRAHAHAARRRTRCAPGCSATSSTTSSEPGVMVAADHPERGRRRIAGHRRTRTAPARPAVTRTARSSTRVIGAPSAASIRSVWSRLGRRLDDLGGAARPAGPASTSAVFTCALATASGGARTRRGRRRARRAAAGCRRRARRRARPSPAAARRPAPSGVATSDSSPVSTERNGRPGEQAGRAARMRRAGVAAVDDAVGLGEPVDARGRRR